MNKQKNSGNTLHPPRENIIAAVYVHENQALRMVEHLIQNDFLMDRISLLGKRFSKGDDILGIYYPSPNERMKVWARRGFIIGALWGLFASLISIFTSLEGSDQPKLFETISLTIIYSAVVGGIMAAAAAFSQIASILHRMGIPRGHIKQLENAIKEKKYVIILMGSPEELDRFRFKIEHSGAELFLELTQGQLEA